MGGANRRFARTLAACAVAASVIAVPHATADEAAASAGADRWSAASVDIAFALIRDSSGKLVEAGGSTRFGHTELALAGSTAGGLSDRGFGVSGAVLTDIGGAAGALDAAPQADGKIVAVTGVGISARGSEFVLVRYTRRGRLDASFGRGGTVETAFGASSHASYPSKIAIQRDGKIVVVGSTSESVARGPTHVALARYLPDGRLDASFGRGGRVVRALAGASDYGRAVAIQPDGKLIVAGETFGKSAIDLEVQRLRTDGQPDRSFGSQGRVLTAVGYTILPAAVVVQPDGELVVAGTTGAAQDQAFALVRYLPDGRLDATFGTNGITVADLDRAHGEVLHALALQPDGKLIVSGAITGNSPQEEGRSVVARLDSDGALDPTFGSGGAVVNPAQARARALALEPAGSIVAAGSFRSDFLLARYRPDGRIDRSFGQGGISRTSFGSLWTILGVMSAERIGGYTVVRWRTLTEGDARGFNVYRGKPPHARRVNPALVRAKGSRGRGARYLLVASSATTGSYWLEEVSLHGTRRLLGHTRVRG